MPDPPVPARSPPSPLRAGNLAYLRKQAKSLLRCYRDGDSHARLRVEAVYPRRDGVPSRIDIGLAEAQFALARELGFASWARLVDHLKRNLRDFSHSNSKQHKGDEPMTTPTNNLGLSAIDQIGLSCTDLDEAQRFYCGVLGLRYAGEAPPMMKFFDCAGVNIIMFKGETVAPGSVIYFRVEGKPGLIAEKIQTLKSLGVKVEGEPRCITQNWHGHDVWLAFFRDPFGNLLALKSDVPVT
jgi:catechol 2,3-dioxygenase-like lactoylglutathione lyase family enzyme